MKILIVDDEAPARSRLRDLLEDIGGHQVVGEAANGREALQKIDALQPELLLLDIHMPEMNGLETAVQLRQQQNAPAIIFTTAYSEHALEAFDADASDYLLKPIRRARLEQALAKVQPQAATAQQYNGQPRQHINANYRGGIKLIPVDEILYFQADSKYVVVHSTEGEILIDESLKSLEDEFADRFTRIHRNSLVANQAIEALEKIGENQFRLRLRGCKTALEVSRRQLPMVRKLIGG